MFPKYRWRDSPVEDGSARELADALELPLPLARVLAARGHTSPDQAAAFLAPNLQAHLGHPDGFPGAAEAAERLWAAVRAGRRIVVYGDFDADGVAAAAVMVSSLKRFGGRASVFLPHRDPEGYGLTLAALERCRREQGGWPDLLVTVDCGITSINEVEHLNAAGVEVILTDHHEPGTVLPRAAVIVNPRVGASPGAEHLCGAGVAFKVIHAMAELGKRRNWYPGEPFCGELLAPVGVATVADVVPLTGENRLLVSAALRSWERYAGAGLRALLARASAQTVRDMDAALFGFVLGPRLNAAGRMGSAMDAYELLATCDRQRATELAARLEGFNGERRGVEARMLAAARHQCGLDSPQGLGDLAAVVVGGDGPHAGATGWHPGVLGIVAARLSEAAARPAAVVAFDETGAGRGSVRAGEGYHALKALAAAGDALTGFGGHERAAGFQVRAGGFAQFRQRFCEACADQARTADGGPCLMVDGWLTPESLSVAFLAAQQRLAPFGYGNPIPRWGLRGVSLERAQPVGSSGEHLQLAFDVGAGRSVRGVWFRHGAMSEAMRAAGGRMDVVFEMRRNDFGGEASVEMRICDLAPTVAEKEVRGRLKKSS